MFTTSIKSSTRISFAIAGLAIVSACGNAETALGPATSSQTVSGTLALTETGTFTANGVVIPPLAETVDPEVTGTTFAFFRDGNVSTSPAMFFGQTSNVYAGVYATDTGTPVSTQGAIAGRVGTTDIRASGFATYTGEYRGIITEEDIAGGGDYDDIDYYVTGDATLNASFFAGTIGGSITNRELVTEGLNVTVDTVSDITLATDTYDSNGLFGASIGGATLDDSGSMFTGGTASYTGVIAGSNSQEVAGTTSILYTRAGDQGYAETGVFIASE